MAHDTTLNTMSGGDTIVTVDLSLNTYPTASGKLPAGCLYVSANATTAPTPLTAANALYVQPGTGAAWTLGAGSALVGQVEISDGTNVLGTSAHPVRTDPTGTTTQPVSIASAVTVTGTFWQATQPVSGTVTANAGTGTLAVSAASLPLPSGAATAAKQPALGTAGTASADVISVQGVASMTALKIDGSATTQPVSLAAATAGGATPYQLISAASTNSTSVKGSAGTVYSVAAFNVNASARYLKLYDKASAPTVGTDTPVMTLMIPAGGGLTLPLPRGAAFSNGIALALTTGMAVSDTAAVAVTEISVGLTYK